MKNKARGRNNDGESTVSVRCCQCEWVSVALSDVSLWLGWMLSAGMRTSLNSGFRVFFLIWVFCLPFFPMSGCRQLLHNTQHTQNTRTQTRVNTRTLEHIQNLRTRTQENRQDYENMRRHWILHMKHKCNMKHKIALRNRNVQEKKSNTSRQEKAIHKNKAKCESSNENTTLYCIFSLSLSLQQLTYCILLLINTAMLRSWNT